MILEIFQEISLLYFFSTPRSLSFCSAIRLEAIIIGSLDPSARKAYSKCSGSGFSSSSGGSSINDSSLPYFLGSTSSNSQFPPRMNYHYPNYPRAMNLQLWWIWIASLGMIYFFTIAWPFSIVFSFSSCINTEELSNLLFGSLGVDTRERMSGLDSTTMAISSDSKNCLKKPYLSPI